MRIAVFISGTGTNLKSLIDASKNKEFNSSIDLVISNTNAKGLNFAKESNINYEILNEDEEVLKILEENKIDFIILAGYLKKISPKILENYKNRIINIHPSLLPKYGGKNFYGMKVHEEVFKSKDKFSGVSVHYVDENLDTGKIIKQEVVDIRNCKSAKEIQEKILIKEHEILKEVVKSFEEEV